MQSPSKSTNEPDVLFEELQDDGIFPNSRLPLALYRLAVKLAGYDPAAVFEQLFAANGWQGSWRDGIYPYHHYHSTAHEVLVVYRGSPLHDHHGVKPLLQVYSSALRVAAHREQGTRIYARCGLGKRRPALPTSLPRSSLRSFTNSTGRRVV